MDLRFECNPDVPSKSLATTPWEVELPIELVVWSHEGNRAEKTLERGHRGIEHVPGLLRTAAKNPLSFNQISHDNGPNSRRRSPSCGRAAHFLAGL